MVSELHYKIVMLALSIMAMTALSGLAQDINEPKVVTGVVLADEEPVIGATVRLKGTDIGAATDYDGRFSLKVPVGSTLEVQYIGMETVEVKVDGKPLVIRMVPPEFWCAWVCNFGYCGMVPEGLFGRVYDSNAHVLPGAIVTVLPSCQSTTTNGKGDFNIQAAEGDTLLRVEHPGYEPRQGMISGNEFVISLDPSPVTGQATVEQLDSLSYAMGDHFIRLYLDGNDKETQQVMGDREEYIRGFSDGLNIYRQESTAASSYFNGQQMGLFFLMSINFEPFEDKETPHLDCLIEGLRKVADNTVVLPQDTIGAHHLLLDLDDEAMLSMVDGDSCRIETTMGIFLGLQAYNPLQPSDRDQGDSISVEDQQAFAAGMADVLENSIAASTYDMGRFAALFYFIADMRMKKLLGLDFDYDAVIDGARGALELEERKMTVEEVEMYLTKYYEAQYDAQVVEELDDSDDIDDALLEQAVKDALKQAEAEQASQHPDEEN